MWEALDLSSNMFVDMLASCSRFDVCFIHTKFGTHNPWERLLDDESNMDEHFTFYRLVVWKGMWTSNIRVEGRTEIEVLSHTTIITVRAKDLGRCPKYSSVTLIWQNDLHSIKFGPTTNVTIVEFWHSRYTFLIERKACGLVATTSNIIT